VYPAVYFLWKRGEVSEEEAVTPAAAA
jgi:hypothetical protein